MGKILDMVALGLMKRKVAEGGGVVGGVPSTLDEKGFIIDQCGRRLETWKEYDVRTKEENKWWSKIYLRTNNVELLDAITLDTLVPVGAVFGWHVIAKLIDQGFDGKKVFMKHALTGSDIGITDSEASHG